GLTDVVAMGSNLRVAPARLEDSMKVRLQRLYPKAKLVGGGDALVVPLPTDAELLEWVGQLLTAVFPEPVAQATALSRRRFPFARSAVGEHLMDSGDEGQRVDLLAREPIGLEDLFEVRARGTS